MADEGGVVFTGDDGSAYFIRDDVLAACKLEGEYLEAAKPLIDGDVEGFALNARATQFSSVASYSSNPGIELKAAVKPGVGADLAKIKNASTIMCPW